MERGKTRPYVVLSTDEVNLQRKTVIIVPLTTTKSEAVPPLIISLPSAGPDSKARIEQIRAVDKSRLKAKLGRLDDRDLSSIENVDLGGPYAGPPKPPANALQRILRIRPA